MTTLTDLAGLHATIADVVDELVGRICALDSEQRSQVLDGLSERVCMHCGALYTDRHRVCYCENDE